MREDSRGNQVRQVRTDLPPDFYAELPRLADGPLSGYPRVYALATEMVAHSDNRVDVEVLRTFVLAYQESQPLRIGEIWAIPIMLRMALVERPIGDGCRERPPYAGWRLHSACRRRWTSETTSAGRGTFGRGIRLAPP